MKRSFNPNGKFHELGLLREDGYFWSDFIITDFFIHLKGRATGLGCRMGEDTETEIFYLLVHYPNNCNGQGWSRLKSGGLNSILVSYMGDKGQTTWAILCLPLRHISRGLGHKWSGHKPGTPQLWPPWSDFKGSELSQLCPTFQMSQSLLWGWQPIITSEQKWHLENPTLRDTWGVRVDKMLPERGALFFFF